MPNAVSSVMIVNDTSWREHIATIVAKTNLGFPKEKLRGSGR